MARDERGTPPSFAPGAGGSRPSGEDAVVVGSSRKPGAAPRAASSTRPTTPRGGGAPPSFTPGDEIAGAAAPRRTTGQPLGAATRSATSAGRPAAGRPTARPPARPSGAGGRGPGGPARPAGATVDGDDRASARPRRRRRIALAVVALVLVLLLAWPIGLLVWANGNIQRTEALSGADGTPGTTYLITGSDSRADGGVKDDGTQGQRSDTILVLHVPDSGPTALISLPRDTYVEIPGHDPNKINAAFAFGGAPLLVETVEQLTGLTVDHYAEIGMAGVKDVVDAVGGVRLCYDRDVDDRDSHMKWSAGCHSVGGQKALQFARMRKADPLGDIGRAQRQRQLVGAVLEKVDPKSLALHPSQQVSLASAATGALTVDESSDIVDLARLALAFKAANGKGGITGTPPIASMDYRPGGVGSTVQLDPDKTPAFWVAIRDGKLEPGTVGDD
ncbi:LCP family protein [Cellulomonas palmilytica]|uniref:LCP family protein n=1 Tax=Cellulomonas palmilytica TaxID=2608402 RepID=UPI001F2912E9|nr:LCP family protein [Cellulomonas palmilytica]